MECVLCERKFNSVSSFYRHNWSDKHLLVLQIKEYEKEIKQLEQKIARNESVLNDLHMLSEKQAIQSQDPFKIDLDKKMVF